MYMTPRTPVKDTNVFVLAALGSSRAASTRALAAYDASRYRLVLSPPQPSMKSSRSCCTHESRLVTAGLTTRFSASCSHSFGPPTSIETGAPSLQPESCREGLMVMVDSRLICAEENW